MNGRNSLMHKKTSFKALWQAIENIYGEIPELIKLVLQLNGFDSFLALRGIRYDDKNEFFSSLETTVMEIAEYHSDTEEKKILDSILGLNYNYKHFKLKPGHRNLIMNLMMEIDKVDVEEFFNKSQVKSPQKNIEQAVDNYEAENVEENSSIVQSVSEYKLSPKNQLVYVADHLYSHDDNEQLELCNEEEEYILEEEEYMEEYIDDKSTYVVRTEDSETEVAYEVSTTPHNKKKSAQKRKPDRMYNDEFLSQSINPRRRRVTTTKTYPDNDEGTRERFVDLIKQSMQCILSQPKLDAIANRRILVDKETDTAWIVVCPLCETRIRLSVVYENHGRYRNYKRSNFERHLRFKHCKDDKGIVMDAVMSIQNY